MATTKRETRREILDPEALARLGSAFDETWAVLSAKLPQADDGSGEQARLRLAAIFIELVKVGNLSAEEMKAAAVRAFSEPTQDLSLEQASRAKPARAHA